MHTVTLSKSKGIGGSLKQGADSFIVKEITKNGVVLEPGRIYSAADLKEDEAPHGNFVKLVMQKRNWDSVHALQEVARRMHRGMRSVGYAGMKDKLATTVQLVSIFGADLNAVQRIDIKDIKIDGAWRSDKGIEMGDLLGNAFEITIADATGDAEAIENITAELGGFMPNYFDRQRFGTRLNNHRIGMHMLKGEFEDAVMEFLTETSNETNEAAIEARRRLAEERDFKAALEYFPGYLRYERSMLSYLSMHADFINAIRKLPRGISLLFVHAVESYIFNSSVEKRIEAEDLKPDKALACSLDSHGFPDMSTVHIASGKENSLVVGNIIGYETNEEHLSSYEKQALDELGITKDDFKIKSMPELSMKGAFRLVFAPFKEFSYEIGEGIARMKFSLPAGSYATVLANEFMKNSGLELTA
jgi:tRNA pseudouridine13 synthase